MLAERNGMFLIKLPYWLGIAADALWAVGLFFPSIFGLLTGRPYFSPDLQMRLIMGVGGSLMTGWAALLLWAVRQPIERRVVILLTGFPVVFGIFVVTLIGVLYDEVSAVWILIKTAILVVLTTSSYILASKVAAKKAANEWTHRRKGG